MEILKPIGQSVTTLGLFWVASLCIYSINDVLMCIGPEMAMKFGFTK